MTVGFVGLGRMGGAMSVRLREAGFALTVWNRTRDRCAAAEAAGATVAASAAEVAAASDVVVTSVSDAAALTAVLEGPDGILAGLRPGAVVVDTRRSARRPRARRRRPWQPPAARGSTRPCRAAPRWRLRAS
jgi:3-hydroxyisobutyrate dehydrogenase-like beta-hydroxyacid dehydrogenase